VPDERRRAWLGRRKLPESIGDADAGSFFQ
jgi:hypothetical protein